jgi:4-hydroxy-tetrahydrodipicolinate reductase
MRQITAVIYGVGAMNSIATRMMLDKDVVIVGALARSKDKIGKDLGEVAGLDRETGILVDDDPERVLGTRKPDIAMIAVASYMDDMYEHLRVCAANGVNALTISEECLYPWRTSPVRTAELDALAKEHGVTLTGSGHQDVYWLNIVTMLMGTAHRIERVTGHASWNVDDYGPEVARDQRVGDDEQAFAEWLAHAERPPTFGRNVIDGILAATGLSATSTSSRSRPEFAPNALRSQALDVTVPEGKVIGFTDIDEAKTAEGPVITFEMTGRLYGEGEADINDWSVEGEPNLRLTNPAVPTQITTCTQYVNRIPDVVNAPPGFVTVDQLPPLGYRAFPLSRYVAA